MNVIFDSFCCCRNVIMTQNDFHNEIYMTSDDTVALTATIIEDGTGGNIAVDETAISGSIQKKNDTNNKNNADRTNNHSKKFSF